MLIAAKCRVASGKLKQGTPSSSWVPTIICWWRVRQRWRYLAGYEERLNQRQLLLLKACGLADKLLSTPLRVVESIRILWQRISLLAAALFLYLIYLMLLDSYIYQAVSYTLS